MAETVEIITGRRAVEARERLGQTQVEVGRAIDVRKSVINRFELAHNTITIERLCQVALALGVEPGSLLPKLDELRGLVGMGGIETLPKVEPSRGVPQGQDYIDAVVAGARAYVAKHGRRPLTNGGDASEYVGFTAKWSAIDTALRRGNNGVPPSGSLHDLLDAHRVGQRRKR